MELLYWVIGISTVGTALVAGTIGYYRLKAVISICGELLAKKQSYIDKNEKQQTKEPVLLTEADIKYLNNSVQVGDIVYYSVPHVCGKVGGFDFNEKSSTKLLGKITSIINSMITVKYESTVSSPPPVGSFISFAKDKRINTSSLVGYYASVEFINNSRKK